MKYKKIWKVLKTLITCGVKSKAKKWEGECFPLKKRHWRLQNCLEWHLSRRKASGAHRKQDQVTEHSYIYICLNTGYHAAKNRKIEWTLKFEAQVPMFFFVCVILCVYWLVFTFLHIKFVLHKTKGIIMYTVHLKKVTFNFSICPGAPGSLNLTDGLDDLKNDQGSLTLT